MRSHSSCLFHTGQSLLVDFDLCPSTRHVFFTLVSRCWWTLTCVLPLVLSFFDTGQSLLVDFGLCTSVRRAVDVFMDVTLWSMSPRISHSGKCLHACHMVSNVSIHIIQR